MLVITTTDDPALASLELEGYAVMHEWDSDAAKLHQSLVVLKYPAAFLCHRPAGHWTITCRAVCPDEETLLAALESWCLPADRSDRLDRQEARRGGDPSPEVIRQRAAAARAARCTVEGIILKGHRNDYRKRVTSPVRIA